MRRYPASHLIDRLFQRSSAAPSYTFIRRQLLRLAINMYEGVRLAIDMTIDKRDMADLPIYGGLADHTSIKNL